MNTSQLTTDRNRSAEVRTRRAQTAAAAAESYDGENLPVLIQLPDLSPASPKATAKPVTASADQAAAVAEPSTAGSAARQPLPVPASSDSTAGSGRRSGMRATGGPSGPNRRPSPPRPSGGIGQYLLAVLLAGALFAVIVTVKESRQSASAKKNLAPGRTALETPASATSSSAPSSTIEIVPPEIAPAVIPAPELPRGPAGIAVDLSEPVAPDAAGYADGAVQVTEYYDPYPSTPVGPVQPYSGSADTAPADTWSVPGQHGQLRSADRNPTDIQHQQR